MECPKCQVINREGAEFCLERGGRLIMSCPESRSHLITPATFRDECGRNLTKPISPPGKNLLYLTIRGGTPEEST